MKMKFILFLGVLAVLVISGNALKCYQCNQCAEPFVKNDDLLKNCSGDDTHCAKGILKYKNGSSVAVHNCVKASSMETPIKPSSVNLSLYESANIYFCDDKDGCNGSGSISAFVSIIFTTLIASLFASF